MNASIASKLNRVRFKPKGEPQEHLAFINDGEEAGLRRRGGAGLMTKFGVRSFAHASQLRGNNSDSAPSNTTTQTKSSNGPTGGLGSNYRSESATSAPSNSNSNWNGGGSSFQNSGTAMQGGFGAQGFGRSTTNGNAISQAVQNGYSGGNTPSPRSGWQVNGQPLSPNGMTMVRGGGASTVPQTNNTPAGFAKDQSRIPPGISPAMMANYAQYQQPPNDRRLGISELSTPAPGISPAMINNYAQYRQPYTSRWVDTSGFLNQTPRQASGTYTSPYDQTPRNYGSFPPQNMAAGLDPDHKQVYALANQYPNMTARDIMRMASLESSQTMDPNVIGGAGNKYRGVFQFGTSEQQKYGIGAGSTIGDQAKALGNYFDDRGLSRNADIGDAYTTINHGSGTLARDGWRNDNNGTGTIADKVAQLRDPNSVYSKQANTWLNDNSGGIQVASAARPQIARATNDAPIDQTTASPFDNLKAGSPEYTAQRNQVDATNKSSFPVAMARVASRTPLGAGVLGFGQLLDRLSGGIYGNSRNSGGRIFGNNGGDNGSGSAMAQYDGNVGNVGNDGNVDYDPITGQRIMRRKNKILSTPITAGVSFA